MRQQRHQPHRRAEEHRQRHAHQDLSRAHAAERAQRFIGIVRGKRAVLGQRPCAAAQQADRQIRHHHCAERPPAQCRADHAHRESLQRNRHQVYERFQHPQHRNARGHMRKHHHRRAGKNQQRDEREALHELAQHDLPRAHARHQQQVKRLAFPFARNAHRAERRRDHHDQRQLQRRLPDVRLGAQAHPANRHPLAEKHAQPAEREHEQRRHVRCQNQRRFSRAHAPARRGFKDRIQLHKRQSPP